MRKIDKLEKEMKSLELNLNIRVQRVENIKHAKVDINKVENQISRETIKLRNEIQGLKAEVKQDAIQLKKELGEDSLQLKKEVEQNSLQAKQEVEQDILELKKVIKEGDSQVQKEVKVLQNSLQGQQPFPKVEKIESQSEPDTNDRALLKAEIEDLKFSIEKDNSSLREGIEQLKIDLDSEVKKSQEINNKVDELQNQIKVDTRPIVQVPVSKQNVEPLPLEIKRLPENFKALDSKVSALRTEMDDVSQAVEQVREKQLRENIKNRPQTSKPVNSIKNNDELKNYIQQVEVKSTQKMLEYQNKVEMVSFIVVNIRIWIF